MTSNSLGSPASKGIKDIDERIQHIKEYVIHYGYISVPLKIRLNQPEMRKYVMLKKKLKLLHRDVDTLMKDFKRRKQEHAK